MSVSETIIEQNFWNYNMLKYCSFCGKFIIYSISFIFRIFPKIAFNLNIICSKFSHFQKLNILCIPVYHSYLVPKTLFAHLCPKPLLQTVFNFERRSLSSTNWTNFTEIGILFRCASISWFEVVSKWVGHLFRIFSKFNYYR